jgi:hypothetical protein
MTRRKFSRDFKIEAARLVTDRGVADQVYNAGLHHGPGKHRIDRLRKSPETINNGNQDIGDMNRSGFVGGSNFQIGWSPYEQDDEQILP